MTCLCFTTTTAAVARADTAQLQSAAVRALQVTCLLADTDGRWSDVRQASRKLLIGILPAHKRAASAAAIVDAAHMQEVSNFVLYFILSAS
jgi:hypothetical protein